MVGAGRYAPSPSGDLHFGNLRTALVAWLCARSTGRAFRMRIEDVDSQRSSIGAAERQLADLALLGLDWDGDVLHQSERSDAYQHALTQLDVYECYCSRREIQEAARAPHVPPGSYPGTCRALDDATRTARRAELAQQGRVPALRLRAQVTQWTVRDSLAGVFTGEVDDFVLRRGGQQPDWAYNLAVVVDDAFQGVDQVVRGDDLLSSAPRQAYLAYLLRLPTPEYTHVPLVLNPAGQRLAKRDGAVTLQQMLIDAAPGEIVARLAGSLGLPKENSPEKLLKHFSLERLPRKPYIFT